MRGIRRRWMAAGLCVMVMAGAARAQGPGGGPGAPVGNLWMYPALAGQPVDRGALWLGMLSAHNAAGGIGSGRLSGTRGGGGSRQPVALIPNVMDTPGAGASGYFNRAPARPAPRPIGMGRQSRHLRQNGR